MNEVDTDEVVRCPACGGRDLRPSRARGWRDAVMVHFHRSPWRCRSCGYRFYRRLELEPAPTEESSESGERLA